ncbi:MAG: alpha/beta fold hydrolase, partial [Planctomycetes bacterium]|nr:alpha/beta fold hydrolase [Planctomycetota bacterium]
MRSAAALAATLAVLLAVLLGASCDYLEHWRRQNDYERRQRSDPSQQNLKHMLEQPNFGVIGRTEVAAAAGAAADDAAGAPVAIAAFSSRFRPHELVGVAHDVGWGSHFGLDLPAGEFDVLALADRDGDGVYRDDEVIARERLELSPASFPSKVVTGFVLDLAAAAERVDWPVAIEVERAEARTSLFYPTGTIRDLADPIFDAETVTLGCYDPAAFFERAPTMFYALEDDLAFKIPVVFVHGFGGSAREFAPLVERLDRDRFKPWFFHYPSGADLDQLATLFYGIFLSGEAVQASAVVPLVIVAHSMGGLVVRRALGMLRGGAGEQAHVVFCSLATPFGGHPSAAGVGDSSVLVLPSWRDLDPGSEFLAGLCREPLPPAVEHWLFYAFDNDAFLKFGENSDGVVPLASQL